MVRSLHNGLITSATLNALCGGFEWVGDRATTLPDDVVRRAHASTACTLHKLIKRHGLTEA